MKKVLAWQIPPAADKCSYPPAMREAALGDPLCHDTRVDVCSVSVGQHVRARRPVPLRAQRLRVLAASHQVTREGAVRVLIIPPCSCAVLHRCYASARLTDRDQLIVMHLLTRSGAVAGTARSCATTGWAAGGGSASSRTRCRSCGCRPASPSWTRRPWPRSPPPPPPTRRPRRRTPSKCSGYVGCPAAGIAHACALVPEQTVPWQV